MSPLLAVLLMSPPVSVCVAGLMWPPRPARHASPSNSSRKDVA